MTDSGMDLLLWAKGPGFKIAVALFLLGMALRLFEILTLGRKPDISPAEEDPMAAGIRTIFSRSLPGPHLMQRRPIVVVGGYIFHIGFFVTLLFFIPHIQLFKQGFGISWPGLPSPLIEAVAVTSLLAMAAVLICRIAQPVRRFLSGFEDYLTWALTFLPLLTGYMAVNKLLLPYTLLLALHILSVELLMAVAPFTKLTHMLTFAIARYYNGAINGRKGAPS
ncbi:MAG: hypothetical protein H7841_11130 [Magnetospirillum sp. WYHS-4]